MWARTWLAVGISAAVLALAVAVLFGLAGILVGLAASAVTPSLPWIGTAVGASLILLGGVLASGRELNLAVAPRAAGHLRAATRIRGLGGYAAYGAGGYVVYYWLAAIRLQ